MTLISILSLYLIINIITNILYLLYKWNWDIVFRDKNITTIKLDTGVCHRRGSSKNWTAFWQNKKLAGVTSFKWTPWMHVDVTPGHLNGDVSTSSSLEADAVGVEVPDVGVKGLDRVQCVAKWVNASGNTGESVEQIHSWIEIYNSLL